MEKIEQPNNDYQKQLDDLIYAKPSEIDFRGKKKKIGWLHKGTVRKFSSVMVSEEDPEKRNTKLCAIVLLNNVWLIRFFYWFYWRYLYYVIDLDENEIVKVMNASKKKVQQEQFYINTILSTGMMDLMMTMTKKEAELIQAEQRGAQPSR